MKIILSVLFLVSIVFADRDGGPYIGVGYGSSTYNDGGLHKELKEQTSGSATYYGGAYINKHLSVELGYVSFTSKGYDDGYLVVDEFNNESYIGFSSVHISTLAHYAFFDDVLDFYAKFGVGEMEMTGAEDSGFSFVYGGGIGLRFSEWFGIKVAFDRYDIKYIDANELPFNMSIDYIYSAIEFQF